ncbi:response regulator, partial [Sedimenticola sp.]|uniref:response regulator n=1 Tax=Sedimenticola sp. TaxID=1940285 RepID=UPI003D0F3278
MKALIIDDHPVFVSALETILKGLRRGIGADTANSAEQALSRIEYYPNYQFILLDLSMPGLDGFTFLRALE